VLSGLAGPLGTPISLAKCSFHDVELKGGAAQQLFSLWKICFRIMEYYI
jgi:hypothetical protein